jgi:DNA-binding transcriptional LysR family regulator
MGISKMSHVHLRRLDLNLLLVFDAIMNERSATRAGGRLHLTQGAVSHALQRLRRALEDELFVRTKEGMLPTARALELAGPVQEALSRLNAALSPLEFNPAVSAHTFRIASTDYFATLMLPKLIRRVEAEAPHVDLRVLPHVMSNVGELLENHEIEFAVGFFKNSLRDMLPHHCDWTELTEDHFMCVMRKDHPLARSRLTTETYLAASHLLFSLTGQPSSSVDRLLGEAGLKRRIGVAISNYLAAPLLLESSNMIMTVPSRMAHLYSEKFDLHLAKMPISLPAVPTQLIWNSRLNRHAAHVWLRSLIIETSVEAQQR